MGYEMSKPHLRAELEAGLKAVCEGRRNKEDVLREQVQKYKQVFIEACQQVYFNPFTYSCLFNHSFGLTFIHRHIMSSFSCYLDLES